MCHPDPDNFEMNTKNRSNQKERRKMNGGRSRKKWDYDLEGGKSSQNDYGIEDWTSLGGIKKGGDGDRGGTWG